MTLPDRESNAGPDERRTSADGPYPVLISPERWAEIEAARDARSAARKARQQGSLGLAKILIERALDDCPDCYGGPIHAHGCPRRKA